MDRDDDAWLHIKYLLGEVDHHCKEILEEIAEHDSKNAKKMVRLGMTISKIRTLVIYYLR